MAFKARMPLTLPLYTRLTPAGDDVLLGELVLEVPLTIGPESVTVDAEQLTGALLEALRKADKVNGAPA